MNKRSKADATRGWVICLLRMTIGVVLVVSAIKKLQTPYDFLGTVYGYRLVGPAIGLGIAIVLPWVELITGALLLANFMTGPSFLVTSMLGVMFVVVQGSSISRGLHIACGCFGPNISQPISYSTVLRAFGVFLAGTIGLFLWAKTRSIRKSTRNNKLNESFSTS